ncbi:taste receptor type 2 member 40-like [Pyxicephalus adspersus]|uniref:taste receptor type 2 member 40-like n=1 Tax=Pyxicephalus adspersus TaxID=30357 RepID=UPI003B59D96A
MVNSPLLGLKLFICLSCGLSGIISNSWILGMNMTDVRRGISLSPCDLILSLMGATNALLQSTLSIDMAMIQTKLYDTFDQFHLTIISVNIFLVSCNLWFTVWLFTYYCLKIVNFSKGILLFLKMRISDLLPRLLLISTIQSFCMAVPSHWSIYVETAKIIFTNTTLNSTEENRYLVIRLPYLFIPLAECSLLLLVSLVPIGMTLASLWKHNRRMRRKETDSCRPRSRQSTALALSSARSNRPQQAARIFARPAFTFHIHVINQPHGVTSSV